MGEIGRQKDEVKNYKRGMIATGVDFSFPSTSRTNTTTTPTTTTKHYKTSIFKNSLTYTFLKIFIKMLFKTTTVVSAIALLFAGQAMGAALTATDPGSSTSKHPRSENLGITNDAVSACNCPNNCSHGIGSSCAYKAGSSTDGSTVNGSE